MITDITCNETSLILNNVPTYHMETDYREKWFSENE